MAVIRCSLKLGQCNWWFTVSAFRKYLAACVTADTSVDALRRVCSHLATATQHNPACAQASPSLSSRASWPEGTQVIVDVTHIWKISNYYSEKTYIIFLDILTRSSFVWLKCIWPSYTLLLGDFQVMSNFLTT